MLLFNALDMKFRERKLRRDPACPICGDNPTIKELIDYDPFCGISPAAAEAAAPQANRVTVWIQAFNSKLGIARNMNPANSDAMSPRAGP